MDRRAFSLRAAALAGALAGGAPLRAQDATPREGRDFKELARPLARPAGAIEVIEFFWYGCPHCFALEPTLDPWVGSLPADVRFRRMPVGFDARRQLHQRIYYTWDALGVADRMHMKTFMRFNVQHKPIDSEGDLLAFAGENGLDADRVRAAWNSFSVASRSAQAAQLTDDYGIDQTPEIGVQGRFTAVALQGSGMQGLLRTTDWLVDRVRKGR